MLKTVVRFSSADQSAAIPGGVDYVRELDDMSDNTSRATPGAAGVQADHTANAEHAGTPRRTGVSLGAESTGRTGLVPNAAYYARAFEPNTALSGPIRIVNQKDSFQRKTTPDVMVSLWTTQRH